MQQGPDEADWSDASSLTACGPDTPYSADQLVSLHDTSRLDGPIVTALISCFPTGDLRGQTAWKIDNFLKRVQDFQASQGLTGTEVNSFPIDSDLGRLHHLVCLSYITRVITSICRFTKARKTREKATSPGTWINHMHKRLREESSAPLSASESAILQSMATICRHTLRTAHYKHRTAALGARCMRADSIRWLMLGYCHRLFMASTNSEELKTVDQCRALLGQWYPNYMPSEAHRPLHQPSANRSSQAIRLGTDCGKCELGYEKRLGKREGSAAKAKGAEHAVASGLT